MHITRGCMHVEFPSVSQDDYCDDGCKDRKTRRRKGYSGIWQTFLELRMEKKLTFQEHAMIGLDKSHKTL